MAKLTLNNLNSGFASTATLNANFDAIEAALENTLSRDGTTPNFMSADLDMNSYRILNCADILTSGNLIARGDWTASTDYAKGDLVNNGTQTYIAVDDHTSTTVFANDSAHWQELFIEYVSITGGGGTGTGTPGLPDASTDDGSGWVLYTDGVTSSWVQASTVLDTSTNTFAVYSLTATGGETTITLPFAYTVGGKNLIVMKNGIVEYPSDHYTEDTANTFTFLTALSAGDKIRVIANIISSAFVPTDPTLAALYSLTPSANKFPYFTSSTAAALENISSFVRSIMNSANASAFLTAIGAGSSSFGIGQSWQDVKASRAINTSYQNTTGNSIEVSIRYVNAASSIAVSTNNSTWITVTDSTGNDNGPMSLIIPNNHYYKLVATGGTINTWAELR